MKDTKFLMILFVALVLDGLDYVGGFLPILGDVFDVFGIVILFIFIGKYALLGGAELIPLVDFLPVFTASVVAWKLMGGKKE